MKKRPKPAAPLADDIDFVDRYLWLLPAALIAGFFYYPEKAWPMENLGLCAVLGLAALASAIGFYVAGGRRRELWLAGIGRAPIVAGMLLALWALARWSVMDVRSAGTEWVLGLLWMAVAMAAGVGAAAFGETNRAGGAETILLRMRRLFIILAIVSALHAFYQYFISYERSLAELSQDKSGLVDQGLLHALRERRISGRLGNPNLFAAQLSMLAVFCVGSLGRRERATWRIAGAAGWLALAGTLVLTASRGGMITFAAASVLSLLVAVPRLRGGRALALVILCATFTHAHAGLLERLGNISTIRERLFYWDIAAQIWAMHPVAGGGPGSFSLLYAGLKSPLARESQYTHSWLMQTGAELGLIGVALEIAMWGGLAWLAWRAARGRSAASERVWPLIALVALALNGFFEFSLQWRAFLVPTGLLAGLACGADSPALTNNLKKRGLLATAAAAAAVIAAAVLSPAWQIAIRYEWDAKSARDARDPQRAAEAFRAAASWQPGDASYLQGEARACMALGQPDRAQELLKKAEAINPYVASLRADQAIVMAQRNDLAGALKKIDEALALYPSNLIHRMTKIRILITLNRNDDARAMLEAIERDRLPMYPEDRAALDEMRVQAGLKPAAQPGPKPDTQFK